MLQHDTSFESLQTLIFIVIILFIALVAWLFLSSCLGAPIRHFAFGQRTSNMSATSRRMRELGGTEGFVEEWEMESRRRAA
ncbi:hypothetical protein AURDEDRAFT_156843 [Auricularia subglabra TFB-10046 SS5]|nr:hypothetical protein AURDEDRAFT_156843 [Auricularia subglabra TFB-10046 SS5]